MFYFHIELRESYLREEADPESYVAPDGVTARRVLLQRECLLEDLRNYFQRFLYVTEIAENALCTSCIDGEVISRCRRCIVRPRHL